MSLQELLDQLQQHNIRISLDDSGDIKVRADKGTLTEQLLQQLKQHKAELVDWLYKQQRQIPITKRESSQAAPLSYQQQRLWLDCQAAGSSAAYHMPAAMIIRGEIDSDQLQQTAEKLITRHQILNCVIHESFGKLFHTPCRKPFILEQSKSDFTAEETEQLITLATEWFAEDFDLNHGPLLRLQLVSLQSDLSEPTWLLLLNIHHLITDGWSNRLLLQEIISNYQNPEAERIPVIIDYLDYCVWQQQQLTSTKLRQQLEEWRQKLADCEPLNFQTVDSPDTTLSAQGNNFTVTRKTTDHIKQFALENGVTVFSLLLGCFQLTLYKFCNIQKFTIACPTANRQREELQNTIGFFVNTLPIKADFSQNLNLQQFINQCHIEIQHANNLGDIPFAAITEALGITSQSEIEQFFQAAINYSNTNEPEKLTFGSLIIEPLTISLTGSKFPLLLNISDGETLKLWIDYNPQYFCTEFIDSFETHFMKILQAILETTSITTGKLSLLSEQEKMILLGLGKQQSNHPAINRIGNANKTQATLPDKKHLHTLFEDQAEKTPEKIAISFENHHISYLQLNNKTNQLAHYLINKAGQGNIIAICIDRSIELSVALLAILKSGNAYLPIDPGLPQERKDFLLADSNARLLIHNSHYSQHFNMFEHKLDISDNHLWKTNSKNNAGQAQTTLFSLIYTSGSTGTPKGVRVLHQGIINRLIWMQQQFSLHSNDIVLQKTPVSFDVSIWELFWPLICGAQLHYAKPDGHKDASYLRDLIIEQGITTAHFVPSMLDFFNACEGIESCHSLRQVFCSGEVLYHRQAKNFLSRLPDCQLYNLYGPTEASIDVSYYHCNQKLLPDGVPIGKPISNTQLHILDQQLQPLYPGAVGEIYIGGLNLAEGYHNRELLNQQCFINNPYYLDGHPSARLYKTGDLGRYLSDGNIEYIGRIDQQVKLRGLRIELGDIEAQLLKHSCIKQATAIIVEDRELQEQQLVLFYTADETYSREQLRTFLAEQLPASMLPNRIEKLQQIPLTVSGKTDRRALQQLAQSMTGTFTKARNSIESKLQEIWQSCFKQAVSTNANFFELGGHSLMASRMIADIAEVFQVDIHYQDIFTFGTITELAQHISQLQQQQKQSITHNNERSCFPLSYQQQRLYLFQQLLPDNSAYNMPASFIIEGQLHIAALEQSLHHLIRRHHILHTCYSIKDETPCQQVLADYQWQLDFQEITSQPSIEELAQQHARRTFNLATELPIRATLYKLHDNRYLFCFCLHHIAGDAWTLELFLEELSICYHALCNNRQPCLPELDIQYGDFADWQHQPQQIEKQQQQLAYWQQQLASAPELLALPHDRSRTDTQTWQGRQETFHLPDTLTEKLAPFCHKLQLTPFILLLSCYQLLLGKLSQQQDICVGIPVNGRNSRQLQTMAGFLVNSLIIRSQQQNNPDVKQFLQQQKATLLAAYANQDIAIEQVLATLNLTRSTAYTPIAQVGFNFLQAVDKNPVDLHWQNLTITPLQQMVETVKYEMTWIFYQHDKGIQLSIEYNTDLFDSDSIQQWYAYFCQLLEQTLNNSDTPIHRLSCIDDKQALQQLKKLRPEIINAYPLTDMQRDIYIDSRLTPYNRQNYIGFVTHSTTELDIDRWKQSLNEIYQHADSLRACILESNNPVMDIAWQVILSAGSVIPGTCFQFTDHHLPLNDTIKNRLIEEVLYTPYDYKYPLWRVRIHRFQEQHHLVILAVHHAMFDGISMQLIGRMMKGNYERLQNRKPLDLPENNYIEYVKHNRLVTDTSNTLEYWQQQSTHLVNYLDFSVVLSQNSRRLISIERSIPDTQWQQLQTFCKEQRITPPVYFKSLFALTIKQLHHITGDLLFHEIVTGRQGWQTNTLGLFFDQQPNLLPDSVCQKDNSIEDIFKYFSKYRKQLKEVTPLSIGMQKQLLPQQIPYLFNFYIMESRTEFQGKKETIEHLMPEMDDAVNFITRVIDNRLQLQIDFNRQQLDGEQFIDYCLTLHQQIMQGKKSLETLIFHDKPVQFIPESEDLKSAYQNSTALSLETTDRGNWLLVDCYGNALPENRAGRIIKKSDNGNAESDYIGMVRQNRLYLLEKADKRSMVQPAKQEAFTKNEYRKLAPPETEMEKQLHTIWCEVLAQRDISIDDNFFELGGHSLSAMRIANRLREKESIELSLESIFNNPTIRHIARLIHETGYSSLQLPAITKAAEREHYPLSFAQQRLWLLTRIEQANIAYNIPAAIRLEGKLNIQALEKAIVNIIERHHSLRSRIVQYNSEPVIIIDEARQITIKHTDYSGSEENRQQWVNDAINKEAMTAFDVDHEHLIRINLLTVNESDHILLITLHHMMADAASLSIIATELLTLYASFCDGQQNRLAELPIQYQDYAIWQQDLLDSEIIRQQLDYWKLELLNAPLLLGLPTDKPRPAIQTYHGRQLEFSLPQSLSDRLRTTAREQGISLFMLLLSSYQLTLHLHCQQKDVCVGIPRDGRFDKQLEKLVGFFINALVIRIDFNANYSIEEIVQQVKDKSLKAFANEHLPAEMVISALGIDRQLSYTPIVQAAFNLINTDTAGKLQLNLPELEVSLLPQQQTTAKFELLLTVIDSQTALNGSFEYNCDLFNSDTVNNFYQQWLHVLEVITHDTSLRLYDLPLQPDSCKLVDGKTQRLTTIQRDLYLASLRKPDTLENSIGYALSIPIELDTEKWQQSHRALADHYDMLRATLLAGNTRLTDTISFKIADDWPYALQIIDWSTESFSEEQITAKLRQLVLRRYDLNNPQVTPLINNLLVKVSESQWYTVLACHHMMLDGMSFTLHAYHLVTNYFNLIHQRPMEFARDGYSDYVSQHLHSFDLPDNISYWKQQLQKVEPLHARVTDKADTRVKLTSQTVSEKHFTRLQQFCSKHRITPALYYQCLYGILIRLYCNTEENFVISEFTAGRSREFSSSMGCHYYRQFFIFQQDAMHGSIEELFTYARKHKQQNKKRQQLSLLTQSRLLPENNLSFSYNFFHMPKSGETEGISFAGYSYSPDFENNIDLRVQLDLGQLTLTLCYQKSLFDENRFLERLQHLSQQVLDGISTLSHLDFLLTDEISCLENDATTSFVPVHALVTQQAKTTPNQTAIIAGEKQLSYQQMEQMANDYAARLNLAGVNAGDKVAIYLPRCLELIPAILAVIKTGGCYLPIDPGYPAERLNYILEDSAATVIICTSTDQQLFSSISITQLHIDTLNKHDDDPSTILHQAAAEDPVYCIYTSGTTGLPKGSIITHGNESNLINWYCANYHLSHSDNCLIFSSTAFDLTQKNLFALLTVGGTVVLDNHQHYDPDNLLAKIQQHHINIINCTPSAFYPLLDFDSNHNYSRINSLTSLLLGGEKIQIKQLKNWILSDGFNTCIVNMYGPTECCDITTAYTFKPESSKALAENDHEELPIGTPINGVTCYLLDSNLKPVPKGITGELYISGCNVGSGYLNRPELTQHHFIDNPYTSDKAHCKLYRSGDMAYIANDSSNDAVIYFAGRNDSQIKINGRRIETTEIEHCLNQLPSIKSCLVLADNNRLHAYVVSEESDIYNWQSYLSQQLPVYMVPQQLSIVRSWPLTANGKIDINTLLNLAPQQPVLLRLPPRSQLEQELSLLWQEVLGDVEIGITDNFFTAGGDSLSAIKLITRIEQQYNIKLPVASLFSAQTITQQAHIIENQQSNWSPIVPIQPEGSKTPIFAIHALGGMVLSYQPLAEALGKDQPFYGIQAYGFEEEQTPYTDLDEMISYYANAIVKQQADGPYQVMGHSFGGLLAVEVARKLQASGHTVERILLLDTYMPQRYVSAAVNDAMLLKIFAEHNFGVDISLTTLRNLSIDQIAQNISEYLNGQITDNFILGAIEIIRGFQKMMSTYKPDAIDLPIILFRPTSSLKGIKGISQKLAFGDKAYHLGWNQVSNQLKVIAVEGSHLSLLENPENLLKYL